MKGSKLLLCHIQFGRLELDLSCGEGIAYINQSNELFFIWIVINMELAPRQKWASVIFHQPAAVTVTWESICMSSEKEGQLIWKYEK